MSLNLEQKKQLENYRKSKLFDDLIFLTQKMNISIKKHQSICKSMGIKQQIPNISITLNNKMVELQNEFFNHGISFYIDYDKQCDMFVPSFLGDVVSDFLINYAFQGLDDLFIAIAQQKIYLKHLEQFTYDLKEASLTRKRFPRIINELFPIKVKNTFDFNDDLEKINQSLLGYKERDENLYKINLRDFIVDAVVDFIDKKEYHSFDIPGLLDQYVIDSFNKLGLSDLLNELCQRINDLYQSKYPYEDFNLNIQPKVKKI